jgi:hypothetical protein
MENKSPPDTTRSRHSLLDTVRTRYLQKYGRDASPTIEKGIEKLAAK